MELIRSFSTDRILWLPKQDAPIEAQPFANMTELCVTIICGVGLVLASTTLLEGALLMISMALMGSALLTAVKISGEVSPRRWPRVCLPMPRVYWPSLSYRPSRDYVPNYLYSLPPPSYEQVMGAGWQKNHGRRPGLPVQG